MGANYGCGDYDCIAYQEEAIRVISALIAYGLDNFHIEKVRLELRKIVIDLEKNAHSSNEEWDWQGFVPPNGKE
ncbi:hypothetical protein LCGC14_1224230 [marine sediment metagenome]|uniref:Uncharacterized protein n=1 Tax=marine sediment metagenome TaxID=412755 RepID=A0A0F9PET7_9ZZZZ